LNPGTLGCEAGAGLWCDTEFCGIWWHPEHKDTVIWTPFSHCASVFCSSNGSLFHCQYCEELFGSSWSRQDVGGWYWCMYCIECPV